MFFLSIKTSLKQVRWLPVVFFCAVMMFGLRLHEKQQAFFEGNSGNFFPSFSFFSGNTLKAAAESASLSKNASKEDTPLKQEPFPSSFPLSVTEPAAPGKVEKKEKTPVTPALPKPDAVSKAPEVLDILNLTTEEVKILQSLATRRNDIEQREKAVSEKEKMVSIMEKRIQDKLVELNGIQKSLKELVAVREKQENEELKGLVKIYELMKPEKAAEILVGLGAETLIDILNGMKDSKLSAILAYMEPSIAQQITTALADRRRLTQEIQQALPK